MSKKKIGRGVNFYSYQEELFKKSMTLEDCIAEVASMGGEGVQLMSEATIPNYPHPPKAWVKEWFTLMERYSTRPTALMTYWDFNQGGHGTLSFDAAMEVASTQVQLARDLGFDILRPSSGPKGFPTMQLIEKLLPVAEKHDVRLSFEVHSPHKLKEHTEKYIELKERTGTDRIGFTLDMSCFQKRYPRVARDRLVRDGVLRKEFALYVTESKDGGIARDDVAETVKRWAGTASEIKFVDVVYNPVLMQDPQDLIHLVPHVFNVHAKIFEMTDQLREYSLDYETIIPLLVQHGFRGSIDTEFEGQRHTQDLGETDSCEQVRRNQVQLRRLLGEI